MPTSQPARHRAFGFSDFLWRWVAALVLVLVTYNPTGYSYFHWVREAFNSDGVGAVHAFVGILLVAGWTVFIVATQRSLGNLGTIIGLALIASGIWLLVEIGLVHADTMTAVTWLVLIAAATLLGIGLSWSHIWRRMSGQLEVDED